MPANLRSLLTGKKTDTSMSRAAARHVKRLPPPEAVQPTVYINEADLRLAVENSVENPPPVVENSAKLGEKIGSFSRVPQNSNENIYFTPDVPQGSKEKIDFAAIDAASDSDRAGSVLMIPTEDIIPNPMQPRRNFDHDAVARLAESIRLHGIIQPLCVRPLDEPSAGYGLIAGERRLRAAKLIGMERVPCIVSPADGKRCAELAIVENLQRENLNMFEEAIAIGELMRIHCLTQEKIAAELSCSQSYVANKLRLLKLTKEDMDLILEEGLTERHARTFLRIKDPEARGRAMRTVIHRRMNVAATEEYVDSLLAAGEAAPKGAARQGKTTVVLRDLRIFHNTLDKALDFIKKAGVPVETVRKEDSNHTEIIIRLPKQ